MRRKNIGFGILALTGLSVSLTGCGNILGGGSGTDDTSTSGMIASAVGGAYNGSGSGGTVSLNERNRGGGAVSLLALAGIPSAYASTACPTILTAAGSGCTNGTNAVTMTYNNCSFGLSSATWSGSQTVAATGISCGSWPSNFTGTVTRIFGSGTKRTAGSGSSVSIDTSGMVAADGNFYSGGTTVTYTAGSRTQLVINGINYVGSSAAGNTLFWHTLTTGAGGSALILSGPTIVGGAVVTFHNLAKVKATSTFSSVGFSAGCCHPTSGTIRTTFSAITGVMPLLPKFVGATETLTFTGCGTADYSGPEGYTGSVTLNHCL